MLINVNKKANFVFSFKNNHGWLKLLQNQLTIGTIAVVNPCNIRTKQKKKKEESEFKIIMFTILWQFSYDIKYKIIPKSNCF